MENNGSPWTTEDLCRRFGGVMDIQCSQYNDLEAFERRGLVRSQQVQDCKTPWILFADADMIYDPDFFADLYHYIDKQYEGMYTAGRMSQHSPIYADALIQREGLSLPIDDAFSKASTMPLVKRSNVGAGFFQLVRTDVCDGYYVTEKECRDKRWTTDIQCARSDRQFRHRIGKTEKLPRRFTDGQIHANHRRDNMEGKHLEVQR